MLPHESIITDAEVRKRPSVQLDYTRFHRRDSLTLWKNRLIVGLGLGAIALGLWWWFSGWWQGGNSPVYAPGPVASVHAAWETQCTVCHAPNESAGRGWGAQTFGVSHTPDSKCQECHAGPKHHFSEKESDTPTCAACHLEHQGRAARLTQNSDRFCTVCHANLADHFADADGRAKGRLADSKIGNWADHPNFNLPKSDPGKLRFNHKLHLSPGMAREGGTALMTWGQVAAPFRERLNAEKFDAAAPVQLDCAACHQPDSSNGAIMMPIVYDVHCQACHPLTVKLPNDKTALNIPHRWQPSALHELLEGMLIGRAMQLKPENLQRPPWTLPGKDDQFKLTMADRLSAVERDMIGSKKLCNECHTFSGDTGKGTLVGLGIEPTHVPKVWFNQAKFNHAAHRLLDCRGCHVTENSSSASDVLIPNIDNCRQCHGSMRSEGGAPLGGVRADCVECHTYHNGDFPHTGKGAIQRAPAKRDLDDFLKPTLK
jgi:hypothetical protein